MIFFKQKLSVLVGSIVLVILVMQGAQAMGLFGKKEPAYPFSGFAGQLFYEGKPAAHAKVTRSYQLFGDDTKHEDTVEADLDGKFSFESVLIEYRPKLLSPVEFISYQEVFVSYKDENIQIWGASKRKKEEFGEFQGSYRNIRCELTEEPQAIDTDDNEGILVTNCNWQFV